jgi:hypothetical protein
MTTYFCNSNTKPFTPEQRRVIKDMLEWLDSPYEYNYVKGLDMTSYALYSYLSDILHNSTVYDLPTSITLNKIHREYKKRVKDIKKTADVSMKNIYNWGNSHRIKISPMTARLLLNYDIS